MALLLFTEVVVMSFRMFKNIFMTLLVALLLHMAASFAPVISIGRMGSHTLRIIDDEVPEWTGAKKISMKDR